MKGTLLFLLLAVSVVVLAQDAVKPRPSPLAIVSTRYKDSYVKITYSQPQKRGREIFGKLVPYGQIWRTGANEATEITLSRDVKLNGLDVRAGTYSLFTIPGKEKWTIILNSDLGLWGSYNYNPTLDILKFEIASMQVIDFVYEAFTILIDPKNSKADLVLAWDKVKVVIPIQFLEPTP